MFGEIGCLVISADEQVRQAYQDRAVVEQLRTWWGDDIIDPSGQLNRKKIADIVFGDPGQRQRLEELLHPMGCAVAAATDDRSGAMIRK